MKRPTSANPPRTIHARDAVELPHVQIRIVEAGDDARVVEERLEIARFRPEAELERDVLDRVAVVVDHDLVEHVVVELEEVRSAVRGFERNEVRDERHAIRVAGADERVDVRVVRERILADERRFAMARRVGRGEPAARRDDREQGTNPFH